MVEEYKVKLTKQAIKDKEKLNNIQHWKLM